MTDSKLMKNTKKQLIGIIKDIKSEVEDLNLQLNNFKDHNEENLHNLNNYKKSLDLLKEEFNNTKVEKDNYLKSLTALEKEIKKEEFLKKKALNELQECKNKGNIVKSIKYFLRRCVNRHGMLKSTLFLTASVILYTVITLLLAEGAYSYFMKFTNNETTSMVFYNVALFSSLLAFIFLNKELHKSK